MIGKLLAFTTTPLGANGEYVSQWYDVSWTNTANANSLADVAGELFLEQSDNGSTVHWSTRIATSANIPGLIATNPTLKYARVRYKNGATAQTSFRCALTAGHTFT
jgi:hypothetical protein